MIRPFTPVSLCPCRRGAGVSVKPLAFARGLVASPLAIDAGESAKRQTRAKALSPNSIPLPIDAVDVSWESASYGLPIKLSTPIRCF